MDHLRSKPGFPRRLYLAIWLSIGCLTAVCGQTIQLSFKHLTPETGLSQSVNRHFLRDRKGFLWIGSEDGLNRFDGTNCRVYAPENSNKGSIQGKQVLGIAESRSGDLWVGTEAGVQCRLAGQHNFAQIRLQGETQPLTAVPLGELMPGYMLVVYPASGKLMVINPRSGDWRQLPDKLPIQDIERIYAKRFVNKADSALVILADKKLWALQWESGQVQELAPWTGDLASGGAKQEAYAIAGQKDSVLWVAHSKGISYYTWHQQKWTHWPALEGRALSNITALAVGSKGLVYAGTAWEGVLVIDPKSRRIIRQFRNNLADPESLAGNSVLAIECDQLGNIWIALDRVGVDFANRNKRKFLVWPEEPPTGNVFIRPSIHTLAVDSSGNTWAGTRDQGIWIFDGNKRFSQQLRARSAGGVLPSDVINHIAVDYQKQIWVATPKGLVRHPAGSRIWETGRVAGSSQALVNPQYLHILQDGSLLCIAQDGIWKLRSPDKAIFDKIIAFAPQGPKASILYDSPAGLFAPPLGRYAQQKGRWVKVGDFGYTGVNSMIHDTVSSRYWVGTDNGLLLLDSQARRLRRYEESDGLASSHINGILLDPYLNLWMGTNKGIIRFNTKHETPRFRNYAIADGLQDNAFGRFAAAVDRKGHYLFGGLKGMNSFDPFRLYEMAALTPVVFTDLEINDRDSLPPIEVDLLKELVLNPDQNSFALHFSGMDYADPRSVKYRVRLDGYDKEWITKKEGVIRYSNLKPGPYVLKIKAANPDGKWMTDARTLNITVKPPIWDYWFVKALAFLLLVVTTYLLVHASTERQLEKQRASFEKQQAITDERTRIAADMHDDLGSGLSMISLMASVAKEKNRGNGQGEELAQIGVTANELIDKMGEIIWALNTKNDSLDSLVRYIRRFAGKLFDVTDISWRMWVQDQLPELICSGKVRRNIFLTCKEALHNIVKHSRAKEASIQVSTHQGFLILSITDKGKGIAPEVMNQFGNGLTNMRKRIEDIGGTFDMFSVEGTEVLIKVPLNQLELIHAHV